MHIENFSLTSDIANQKLLCFMFVFFISGECAQALATANGSTKLETSLNRISVLLMLSLFVLIQKQISC